MDRRVKNRTPDLEKRKLNTRKSWFWRGRKSNEHLYWLQSFIVYLFYGGCRYKQQSFLFFIKILKGRHCSLHFSEDASNIQRLNGFCRKSKRSIWWGRGGVSRRWEWTPEALHVLDKHSATELQPQLPDPSDSKAASFILHCPVSPC